MIKSVTELAKRLGYKIIYRCIEKDWVEKGEGTFYCQRVLGININDKYKNSPFRASFYIAQCICLLELSLECSISTAQEYGYELLARLSYLQFNGKRPEVALTGRISWATLNKCYLKSESKDDTAI